MGKSYFEMTQAERLADRIAKNREIERKLSTEKVRWELAEIVKHLNTRKQRATYGAVAKLVGVLPRGLMAGRGKSPEYSWVVAGSGRRRGWPTDYEERQIHPDCLRQILLGESQIIDSEEALRLWLKNNCS